VCVCVCVCVDWLSQPTIMSLLFGSRERKKFGKSQRRSNSCEKFFPSTMLIFKKKASKSWKSSLINFVMRSSYSNSKKTHGYRVLLQEYSRHSLGIQWHKIKHRWASLQLQILKRGLPFLFLRDLNLCLHGLPSLFLS
jgi:hypothetical protein